MRKVLAWLLLLTLVMGIFAGCNNQTTEPTADASVQTTDATEDQNGAYTGPSAQDAIEYLESLYQNEGAAIGADYSRYATIRVGGESFDVVWTVSVSEDLIKIVDNGDGTCTIDINEECEEETPYVLTATITDPNGESASHSWNYILPEGVSAEEIIKAAYALRDGEVLPYQATLRGKVVSIDELYDNDYKNITVTIAAEGFEDKPIKCYRLKGEGVDKIVAGNIITVTGTIKNYKGTIEFDTGCTMDKWEEGTPIVMPTDPFEILDMIYDLPRGASLPAPVTLTGIITSIDTPYDEGYGNITVTIAIPGRLNKPIMCYRMKGDDLDKLKTSDEITVTGTVVNYQGTREFNAGCKLVKVVPGSGHTQPKDPVKVVEEAYNLPLAGNLLYEAELTGTITKINTKYSASYGNITVTFVVAGAENKPIECYRMTGDKAKLAALKVGDQITVKGLIKNYYSFSNNTSKIQYDKPVLLDCVLNNAPQTPTNTAMLFVSDVKPGVAYKFGLQQNALSGKPFQMITGAMDGYYFETVTDAAGAIDTYVEAAPNGGYYIYTLKGSTKQYINIVVSGTYYNVKYQSTPSNVWTLNTQYKYVMTTASDGTDVYLGTYNQNSTVGASKTSFIADTSKIGVSQFCAWFLEVDPNGGSTGGDNDQPTTGNATVVTNPVAETAYKMGMDKGDGTILYFNGQTESADVNYRLATTTNPAEAVDVKLEAVSGGYRLYFMNGNEKTYIRVYHRTDGDPGYGKGSLEFVTAAPSEVFTYDTTAKTLFYDYDGNNAYYMGTYSTFTTFSVSNTFYITGSNASNVDTTQFPARFYTVDETSGGDNAGATVVANPVAETAYKMGMNKGDGTILYFNGQTESASVNYRLATTTNIAEAVDVKLEAVSGGYRLYFMNGSEKTYIRMYHRTDGDPGYGKGSLEFVTAAPSEVYTYDTTAKTLVYDYDGNNAYYMGTYSTFTTFSVSNTFYITGSNASNVDATQFPARFYTVGGTSGGNQGGGNQGGTTTGNATMVTSPVAETAYKMGMNKGDGTILYFNGQTESASVNYRLATTTNIAEAVDVKLEAVSGGYRLYFMNGNEKTYIRMYHRTDGDPGYGKGSLEFVTAAPSEVYTYDTTAKTLVYDYDGNNAYYMGTYSTFTTFSVSNTFYITGSNASNVDATQFPARFYTVSGTSGGDQGGGNQGGNTGTMTPEQIVDAAYALGEGEALEGTYTLTGKVYSVDEAYSSQYKNVTVTIVVGNLNNKPIKCYRMKGDGADVIKAGDTITVTGTLKNYYGTIEFDAGCTLDSYVEGVAPEVTDKADATITFDNTSKRTSISTEQQVWKENGITLTNDKGGSTSNVAEFIDPVRLYSGSAVTISYTKAMTKIEVVCDSSSYATTLVNSLKGIAGVTASMNVKVVTITFSTPVTSIAIAALTSQVRVKQILVYC